MTNLIIAKFGGSAIGLDGESIPQIVNRINNLKTDSKLIIFGPQQLEIKTDNLPDKIELYRSVESFMSNYFIQTILS